MSLYLFTHICGKDGGKERVRCPHRMLCGSRPSSFLSDVSGVFVIYYLSRYLTFSSIETLLQLYNENSTPGTIRLIEEAIYSFPGLNYVRF